MYTYSQMHHFKSWLIIDSLFGSFNKFALHCIEVPMRVKIHNKKYKVEFFMFIITMAKVWFKLPYSKKEIIDF